MSRRSWAVGKKAEDLAKRMMEALGFDVIPFGYEHIFKEYTGKHKLLKGDAAKLLRAQPDFVIVDPKTNKAFFIEVKYRYSGKISEKSIKDYPENYVLLITNKGILIADWEYMIKHKDKNCFKLLTEIGPFRFKDKEIIKKYVEEAKKLIY